MAISAQKFLPGSKGTAKSLPQAKISGITLTSQDKKNVNTIRVKTIQVDKILKGTLAADKKRLNDKKKEASKKRKDDVEAQLEKKPTKDRAGFKMPKILPKMGFLDWIKNFIGSILYLNNSFISEIIPPVPSFEDSNPQEEFESSDVKARWIISDISGATLTNGSIGYINNMWAVFNTLSDNEKEILRSIEQRGFQPNNGLYQKYKNTIDGPRPFFDFNSIIKLKSVSSKPNVSTKYTWKISGRDYRGDKSRSFQNQVYGSDDVQITGGRNNTFFQETSSEGSEIELKLSGADTHISVQLNIECKLGDGQIVKDFVYIPYCIRTNR